MPIYEYFCSDCENSFETLVKAGENPHECPRCHGAHLSRQLSAFAAARSVSAAPQTAANGASKGCCGGTCGCC